MQPVVSTVALFESVVPDVLAFDAVRTYLQELASTEGRLAVSFGVVVLALVVGGLVLPFFIRTMARWTRERVLSARGRDLTDVFNDYIPSTIAGVTTRFLQLIVAFLAALSLFVVWGLVDVAVTILQIAGLSLPLFVRIVVTLLLLVFAYIALDVLADAVHQFSEEADRVTRHQEEIMLRLGHVGVLAFAGTGMLTLWGVDLSGLLVGAGFLGIVLGLAARQTLGSMIAGFVLMFSRPFSIGDWVEVGGHEGIITSITIMNTRMQNFDGESVVIPNDVVANQPIRNLTRQGILRLHTEVGVDYSTDPEFAESVALETIAELDEVASSPPPQVVPTEFADSAVVLDLRFWIENPDPPQKWRTKRAVIHAVKERFQEEGIKIPFPQRELSGREETAGLQITDARAPDTSASTGVYEKSPESTDGQGDSSRGASHMDNQAGDGDTSPDGNKSK